MERDFDWGEYRLSVEYGSVLTAHPLPDANSPSRDRADRCADSVDLHWDSALDEDGIDGYVILRRFKGEEIFSEIARIEAGKTCFEDHDVRGMGTKVFYVIAGYKMDGQDMRLSTCAGSLLSEKERVYQNPEEYVQISSRISTHGCNYYTSPVLVDSSSSRDDHIEALIKTAFQYEGDPCVRRWAGEPGVGIDCSGLIMQACYGAGVDLWPCNPYRHRWGSARYEWESREISRLETLKTVPYDDRRRGDLILYGSDKGTVIHSAIYLGNDTIIQTTDDCVEVTDVISKNAQHIAMVKRIFN